MWSLDDPLDLGDLVTGSEQEVRADGTDLFVLLERGRNSFGTRGIGAFADELGVVGSALSAILSFTSRNSASVRAIRTSRSAISSPVEIDWQFNNEGRRKLVAPTLEACGLTR